MNTCVRDCTYYVKCGVNVTGIVHCTVGCSSGKGKKKKVYEFRTVFCRVIIDSVEGVFEFIAKTQDSKSMFTNVFP